MQNPDLTATNVTRDETIRFLYTYGVFVWRGDNRYNLSDGKKFYRNRLAAEKFADKHLDLNYVVRPLSLIARAMPPVED